MAPSPSGPPNHDGFDTSPAIDIDDLNDLAEPRFRPDPSLSTTAMKSLQRELAARATFDDDIGFAPEAVAIDEPADLTDGLPPTRSTGGDSAFDRDAPAPDRDAPVVVGVDQAFITPEQSEAERGEEGDRTGNETEQNAAVSAAVAIQDGVVIEYASARTPLSIPYIPGLLAFREGEPLLAALDALEADPDLLVCDGSGRIHFREAGIATHIGVLRDVPSVGVAKRLLCGTPAKSTDERLEGWRTPVRADASVETVAGDDDSGDDNAEIPVDDTTPVIGYAYQSRQYPNSRRINPLYVSPGHRLSAETATDLVEALCAGYKLPEPTRIADAAAEAAKRSLPCRSFSCN